MATAARMVFEYGCRDERAVEAYLREHPDVIPTLEEASRWISHYFGMKSTLILDVLTDPEEPASKSLFALIRTSLDPDEALSRLDKFNNRWWRGASADLDADIHFGLDYV
jgi:hypothetical protein